MNKPNRSLALRTIFMGVLFAGFCTPASGQIGDPVPGIDILLKRPPNPRATLGGTDFGSIQPGDLFTGSTGFNGEIDVVAVSDAKMDLWWFPGSGTVDFEIVALQLRSLNQIVVQDSLGVDSFFDVWITANGTGQMTLSTGSDQTVIDSFFEMELRFDVQHSHGGGAGGGAIWTESVSMDLVNPFAWGTTGMDGSASPFVPGFDGITSHAMSYASASGETQMSFFNVPSPGTLSIFGLSALAMRRRR
ncbi:MAG: hypothetical protein ACI89L_000690 [Phycisphaerales bacterium]|jgi:hypothetical protein